MFEELTIALCADDDCGLEIESIDLLYVVLDAFLEFHRNKSIDHYSHEIVIYLITNQKNTNKYFENKKMT